jgi:outer membrane protein OmpA-like peptidoglycan-associated protein
VIRTINVPVNEGEGTLELNVNLPRGSYNTHALAINQVGTSGPVIARPDLIYRPFFEPSRTVGKPSLIGTKASAAISFVPNSAKLSERSKADLREVAKTLINSDSRVAVTGFSAKWLRGKTHEARLATARAYRVGKFLQSQGVDNWIYYYGVPSIETNTPQKNAWKSELRILPN